MHNFYVIVCTLSAHDKKKLYRAQNHFYLVNAIELQFDILTIPIWFATNSTSLLGSV